MIKVSDELDQVVVAKAHKAEQEHVFRFWSQLSDEQQRALLDQLASIDFQLLGRLTKLLDREPPKLRPVEPLTPLVVDDPARRAALAERGWEALRGGKVALLLVAGGQGTRLGWPGPKGTYGVSPVLRKSLYQLFAEQVRALGERSGRPLRWFILTSTLNRAETERFFVEHGHFGLAPEQVTFLVQRELPNVDLRGKLLMASPWQVAMSPNGHGGALQALIDARGLDALAREGVETVFYWQVDNPLCPVADPVFLGAHLEAGAEASSKVVKKTDPGEKIGLLAQRDGRVTVVEYSEMSAEQQRQRDPSGELSFRAGSIAVHLFERAFLARLGAEFELEYHLARKAVPCVDEQGGQVTPREPNAVKFETFIFDVLPEARGHVALEVDRAEEFEPLKNADGEYSPETVRRAQSERHARWLEAAGYPVERDADGRPVHTYEISPLTALGPEDLRAALGETPPTPKDGAVVL